MDRPRGGAKALVRGELQADRRVLWVSNRVSDCQETFKSFGDRRRWPVASTIDPGFLLSQPVQARCDRKQRHKELIRAFQDAAEDEASRRGILGATTQVCEMSLDLDAEILVTELAPIASLIQRWAVATATPRR